MDRFQELAAAAKLRQGGDVIQDALVAIRNHLGMEVAYFSEFVGNESVFRRVDAPGLEHLIKPGDRHSLDDVYCRHILEGRLPELIPDTRLEEVAAKMPITSAIPIGSHVSVPVMLDDGTPYGMFCCLSHSANPGLNERDLQTMRVFANLAARQVNSEINQFRNRRQKTAQITDMLTARDFDLYLQPVVNLETSSVYGYEALTRFRPSPYRSPDLWFSDAFEVDLGIDLELATISEAVALLPRLPGDAFLSINASPATVASGRLADCLDPLHLDRTILEITEHAAIDDFERLCVSLQPLRHGGMRVAVDDAGAGHSGLRQMIQLSPEIIKLDMSLTRGIDADAARRALTSAMIFYAHETGCLIVAEGIETPAELETLRALGVQRGQGYLLCRPAPAASFMRKNASSSAA